MIKNMIIFSSLILSLSSFAISISNRVDIDRIKYDNVNQTTKRKNENNVNPNAIIRRPKEYDV